MAFQPYQPFGKKRKTQQNTGANMKQEGQQVAGGVPSPITTQGPIQNNESAAKMAAANQVMNKPVPAAPQMNPIGMSFGGWSPDLPQSGQAASPFNPASMANMKSADGRGMAPMSGEFWNQTDFGQQFGEQLDGTSKVNDSYGDIMTLITSGDLQNNPNIDNQGNNIIPEEESAVGADLATWLEEMMGQSAEDEAAKVSGDLIRSQRSMMGRGLTGGTAARQSDTFTTAVEGAKERINREKLGAATGMADLEKWQAGFDRQGGQLDKEDERYNKSRLLEAMALKEDLGLNDEEFRNLLRHMGLDPNAGGIMMGDSGDGGDGDNDPLEEEDVTEEVVEEEERFTESAIPAWANLAIDLAFVAVPGSQAAGIRVIEMAMNGEIESKEDFGAALVKAYGESSAVGVLIGALWEVVQGMLGGEDEG